MLKSKEYLRFIKASFSSFFSALIDLSVFYIICQHSTSFLIVALATIISRCTSTIVNFVINKFWAFNSVGSTKKEAGLFGLLFIGKMSLSAILVWLFSFVKIPLVVLKGIIDLLLFFISYYIQKKYIFIKTK